MRLQKIKRELRFNKKRNYKLITPCCNRSNSDGKFINFIGMSDQYGYCHSCGKTTLPQQEYQDDKGQAYIWNEILRKFEKINGEDKSACNRSSSQILAEYSTKQKIKFVNPELVRKSILFKPENNLLFYIRKTFDNQITKQLIARYYLGSDNEGYTLFWNIDKDRMVRKLKAIKYDIHGKRTNKIRSPYLNEDGYRACLFGEHLLDQKNKDSDIYILVESEKTAVIASALLPEYRWLAYGGINGLTTEKMRVLIGFRVLIIPDMSENAVSIIKRKIPVMKQIGIQAKLWDMTKGRSDEQLKKDKQYNNDLEDVIRKHYLYAN